jgi:Ion transport protein
MNYPKLLKSVISCGCMFLGSDSGETPLSLALNRKSKLCAEIIIKRFPRELYTQNASIFEYIGEVLPQLNQASLKSLPSLYDAAFPVVSNQSLPKFGILLSKPPIIVLSNTLDINVSKFLANSDDSQDLQDLEIEFRQTLLRLDMEKGSPDGVKFIKTLQQCNNSEVFKSQLVKVFLLFKWKQIKPILFTTFILHLITLTCLMVQTVILDIPVTLILIITLNTIFLLFESAQLKMRLKSYFLSYWNWIDIARIAALYLYPSMVFSGRTQNKEWVLALANALTYARIIGFIRIFEKTRYMIQICLEVMKRMGPFVLIYFIAIIGVCISYYSDSQNPYTFKELFENIYSLSYGQFQNSNDTNLQTFVFVIATLILTLVLLNLIIALMGDIFQQIKSTMEIADKKEMVSIILEYDSIMWTIYKEKKNSRMYIQQCSVSESKTPTKLDIETEEILKLSNSIDQKSNSSKKKIQNILNLFDQISASEKNNGHDKIQDLLLEIKTEIKDTKKEIRLDMMKTKLDIAEIRKGVSKIKGK